MIQLLRYAKDYRKQIILGPVFKFLEAVFELILPLLMASLIDNGLKMNDRGVIIQIGDLDGRDVSCWIDLCDHLSILCFNSFTRIWY